MKGIGELTGISYEYHGAAHEVSHSYLFPIIEKMLRNMPKSKDATLLDLGCGNGSFLSLLQGQGWRLIGIDFSPSGIEIARASYPEIEFFLADAQSDLGKHIGEVDVVVSTEVIEHLYDPRGFFRNAYRLLKPGGILIVTTPYHGYLKNLMLALTGSLDRHFTVLWDHGHIKFWSRATLTQALDEAGFAVEEFTGSGRLLFLWKSMVIKARKKRRQ
jgi:2-polyprenyl-3-methyl-5-hydroxy-6-metoxy-1,4-benzoquinol methylase